MDTTCAFVPSPSTPHDCRRDGIFRREYQRANRMHGVKILRCFPHCCPHHKPRSYCGQSLCLHVSRLCSSTRILVFARFRRENQPSMRIGDEVRSSDILSRLQSDESPTAEWVASSIVSNSGVDRVFEINPSARWVYTWSSGASKEQRLTTHVLEAVVVQAFQDQDGSEWYRFLAVTQSPTFRIVSFRRSEDTATDQSLLYRALEWERRRDETRESSPVPIARVHLASVHHNKAPSESPDPRPSTPRVSVSESPRPRLSFIQQIQVIFSTVTQLPARELVARPSRWPLEQLMLHALVERDAVQLAAQLVWWLRVAADDIVADIDLAYRLAESLLDLQAMAELYEQFTTKLQQQCELLLARNVWSVAALSSALTAVRSVSSHATVNPFSWETFLARARHRVVLRQSRQRYARSTLLVADSMFQATTWTCEPDEVRVYDLRRHDTAREYPLVRVLSVEELFLFWAQLRTLRIAQADQSMHLSSRSMQDLRAGSALHLILDGRCRIFEALPNGEPSLGAVLPGGYSIGDYIGRMEAHASSARVVLTTFAWPSEQSRGHALAYRWQWAFAANAFAETMDNLDVSVQIDAGRVRARAPLDTMPLQEKLELLEDWTPHFETVLRYRAAATEVEV